MSLSLSHKLENSHFRTCICKFALEDVSNAEYNYTCPVISLCICPSVCHCFTWRLLMPQLQQCFGGCLPSILLNISHICVVRFMLQMSFADGILWVVRLASLIEIWLMLANLQYIQITITDSDHLRNCFLMPQFLCVCVLVTIFHLLIYFLQSTIYWVIFFFYFCYKCAN